MSSCKMFMPLFFLSLDFTFRRQHLPPVPWPTLPFVFTPTPPLKLLVFPPSSLFSTPSKFFINFLLTFPPFTNSHCPWPPSRVHVFWISKKEKEKRKKKSWRLKWEKDSKKVPSLYHPLHTSCHPPLFPSPLLLHLTSPTLPLNTPYPSSPFWRGNPDSRCQSEKQRRQGKREKEKVKEEDKQSIQSEQQKKEDSPLIFLPLSPSPFPPSPPHPFFTSSWTTHPQRVFSTRKSIKRRRRKEKRR